MNSNKYEFECVVEFEKFYSEDSFYGAYNVTVTKDLPHTTIYLDKDYGSNENVYFMNLAGKMQQLYLGCKYKIVANLEFNKRYNTWQYVPETITATIPTNDDDVKKFLESIITKPQAQSLLEVHPSIVEDVMNDKEIDLGQVKGIKEKTFSKIKEKILNTYVMSDLLILLQPLNISFNMIQKIHGLEKNPAILKNKILQNPYILTKVKGLGFKKVDAIALKLNPDMRVSQERVRAYIEYYFTEMGTNDGHTWCTLNQLESNIKNNIDECYDIYIDFINSERREKYLHIVDNKIGLKRYYETEKYIIEILNNIHTNSRNMLEEIDYEKRLKFSSDRLGFSLTDEQTNSVLSTLYNGVTLLTAKSGSGKTTCINGIIDLYHKYRIALCGLAARAARRITEATGKEAYTIHKLLGFGKGKDNETFLYNENNPLPYDIVVVDEASMINADIFLALLRAISPTAKIIIVFDNAQLPPIGYGNVATDLLGSNFNIFYLTKVHRQAKESGIFVDGNKIREQISPIDNPAIKEVHGKLKDMCYMFRNNREQLQNIAVNSYLKYIKESGIENTMIIVPRRQNCINSALEINKRIQDELIPNPKKSINRGDVSFKLGCRVIQKVNNAETNCINGELGYVTDIWKEKDKDYLEVTFDDGKKVAYSKSEFFDIELGYALTVHSCQGSEAHTVIVVVDNTHYALLSSNLLYTAVTRGKKRCLLLAEPSAFKRCIQNKLDCKRNTFLSTML